MLEKYSDEYGLETFPEIGSRYLENYVSWAKEADEISTLYMEMADSEEIEEIWENPLTAVDYL